MSGVLHGVVASLAGRVRDAFFRYVTLLLNTSATNGAQNNTFLDSSTNNFSITRNGDTTQGSFNPYMPSGYWSGFFDGTDDRLTAPNNAAFQFGTGAYTIESWVYLTALDTDAAVIFESGNATNGIGLFIAGSSNPIGARKVYVNRYGAGEVFATTNACIVLNAWNHVAVVRSSTSSNDTKIYVNGVLEGTGTDSNNWTVSTTPSIGGLISFSTYDVFGYLSNLRVVKGTAVYTAAFTPPTTPLTAITNTSLLCLQDNRFIDNSTNAFTITRNGDTRISKFAPFNPPASYSTASYGGSGYFDGTGDYLTTASSTSESGNFTLECWVNPSAATTGVVISWGSETANRVYMYVTNTGVLAWGVFAVGDYNLGGSVPVGAWSHIAIVRSGTTVTGYVNGTSVGTTAYSGTAGNTGGFGIGAGRAGGAPFTGYISNARAVQGTAVYTANFTPPTTPLTAITNTSLLLNFTNAGIFDAATINNGQTVGNAQVSTTQAKWGTTSMYFDGTDDRLVFASRPEIAFGTGNFTVEGWVYRADTNVRGVLQISGTAGGLQNSNLTTVALGSDVGQVWRIYANNNSYNSTATWSINTWYHFALVRNSGTTTLYIDGTSVISQADTTNYTGTNICVSGFFTTAFLMNGYIQDLRITNGYARYTANFTAPTAAFPTL